MFALEKKNFDSLTLKPFVYSSSFLGTPVYYNIEDLINVSFQPLFIE
jgi:hypothetical protein